MRIKFVRSHKGHLKGSIYNASPNEAFGLIDSGAAILTKDMTAQDYKLTSDEEQADGNTSKLRTNNRRRR